jgi:hypothetical protein
MQNRITQFLGRIDFNNRMSQGEVGDGGVPKEIGDYLRTLCGDYVNVNSEREAERRIIELGIRLDYLGLSVPRLFEVLQEKRKKIEMEKRGEENIADELRSIYRDYLIAASDKHAEMRIEEFEDKLKECEFYSGALLGGFAVRRYGIKMGIHNYVTAKSESEREGYRSALEHQLKQAKFGEEHIDNLFRELDAERVGSKQAG